MQLELFHQHEFTTRVTLDGPSLIHHGHTGARVDFQHCPCGGRRELFACTGCGDSTSYVSEPR